MSKYRVIYGYCHPNAKLVHPTKTKICNTFDEAKQFIAILPKTEFMCGFNDCHCTSIHGFLRVGKEPSKLYAKIRAEKKDFWIEGNKNDVWMKKGYIGSNNPI